MTSRVLEKSHQLRGRERGHLPSAWARREDQRRRVTRDQSPLDGVSERAVEEAVDLANAVVREAAIMKPPVGGLDIWSRELDQRQRSKMLIDPTHVELVALVGAGPDAPSS